MKRSIQFILIALAVVALVSCNGTVKTEESNNVDSTLQSVVEDLETVLEETLETIEDTLATDSIQPAAVEETDSVTETE